MICLDYHLWFPVISLLGVSVIFNVYYCYKCTRIKYYSNDNSSPVNYKPSTELVQFPPSDITKGEFPQWVINEYNT